MLHRLLLICLFCCLSLTHALAQDTTIVLSTSQFNERHTIRLSELTGWVYKPGHNPAWASPNLNTTDWAKRQTGTLSARDANAGGKAEGWLRVRIRLDSTFNRSPLGVGSSSWAASEVYVNGKWAASFGSTGTVDKPYADYKPNFKLPLAIQLEPGKDYLIAIHFVDQVFPFPPFAPKKLKSEIINSTGALIWLSRPECLSSFLLATKTYSGFSSLWLTVSLLLALLFWLLSTQELPERNIIRLWATVETFFAISTLFRYAVLVDISFTDYYVTTQIVGLFEWQNIGLALIAYLRVFGYRIPNKWIGIGVVVTLVGFIVDSYLGAEVTQLD